MIRKSPMRKVREKPRRKSAKRRVAVVRYDDGREVCDLKTKAGKHEYYCRLAEMMLRQGMTDPISGEWLSPSDVQFDHQDGRGMNAGHRNDRIVVDGKWQNAALSSTSNMVKGSRRYEWRDGKYLPKERA